MYARLWWKDARQFWPIWVFLAVTAAVWQVLLLYLGGSEARAGWLGLSALLFASLYAFATGAAAFAGERETGTLRLLDTLPADRRVVWLSKVSFAFVTTTVLALLLLALAAVGTDKWKPEGTFSVIELPRVCMLVAVALGWGLFWSAILSNALTAAVLAICCTGVSLGRVLNPPLAAAVLPAFALASCCDTYVLLGTIFASLVSFVGAVRWIRIPFKVRSPIPMIPDFSDCGGNARVRRSSAVAPVLSPSLSSLFEPRLTMDRPRSHPRSWIVETRAMAWQTMKEGRNTWCLLALVQTCLNVLLYLGVVDRGPFWQALISIGVAVVSGVCVFGLENRWRTQRFLAHHGARPNLVWLVKLTVWNIAMVIVLGPAAILWYLTLWSLVTASVHVDVTNALIATTCDSAVFITECFAVALVCGMAIRRGFTAVVIAVVIGLLVLTPLGVLPLAGMLPMAGLLVIPAGLLVVSWAWSGDWMFDRPGSGRWVRLGFLLTGMLTVVVSWYAGYRAWGIRDVGPVAPPAGWTEPPVALLPAGHNAAALYREVGSRLIEPVAVSPQFLKKNREIVGILHRATALLPSRFFDPQKMTALDQPDVPPMSELAALLALDATEREAHDDLASAWDDIVAIFRMAHQLGHQPGLAMQPLLVEQIALRQALQWAVARGQTLERLRVALADYLVLPKPPAASDMIRGQAALVENATHLPVSKFRDWAYKSREEIPPVATFFNAVVFDLATMPCERVRARRVNHLLANAAIRDALLDPWQRARGQDPEIQHAEKTSRTTMMLICNPASYVTYADVNEVGRRALVQVFAFRTWQLKHGGEFPKSLDALVPEDLPSLPNDPYSGQPFRYLVPTDHRAVASIGDALVFTREKVPPLVAGSRVLYSVGPNFRDDGGVLLSQNDGGMEQADIVFEIPPLQKDAKTTPTPGSKPNR